MPDVVIVGAGTAGCVVAHRLAAAGAEVLLLEAGPDTPPGAVPADIRDPFPRSYYNPGYMWPRLAARLKAGARHPEPFPQARVVGGGSSVAGMVGLRGLPGDYAGWAPGWGWDDVLPYLRRVEERVPLHRFAPAQWPAFARAVGSAAERRGYPFRADLNAEAGDGYGPLPLTRTADERASAASAYLDAATRRRPNLTIAPGTTVTRLRFAGQRCVGVEAQHGDRTVSFAADRVVLCAGAIHSPAILMRSGIGPADPLRALGLPVVAPLAGVGANLQNHPVVYLATHLRPPARRPPPPRAQFVAGLRFAAGDMVLLVLNRSSWSGLGESVVGLGVGLYRPLSRGVVRVTSTDAGTPPRVDFDMLADPADVDRLVDGLRLALELMQDDAVRPLRDELFTAAYSETVRRLNRPGRASRLGSRLLAAALDGPAPLRHGLIRYGVAGGEAGEPRMASEAWRRRTVARRTMGMYHPAGTCRMGEDGDPGAVVDGRCAVHGVAGLHVVDASVMPTLVRGTLNLPVMMIAERVCDALAPGSTYSPGMPKAPLPEDLQEFLRAPNPCVVSSVRPDGELHATATWYEWTDHGTVLLNMDGSRRRLDYMRANPRVALTMLASDWYSHVSLTGRVREIRPDADLSDIDRISRHYTGRPYPDRERDSWTAEVEVERWHSWGDLARRDAA